MLWKEGKGAAGGKVIASFPLSCRSVQRRRRREGELKQWKTSEASGESRFAEGFQDLLVVSLVPRHLWHRSTERSVPSLCNQQAPSDQRGGGVYSPEEEEEEELRVETLTFLFRSSFPLLVLPLLPFEFPSDPLSSLFEKKGDTWCSKRKKSRWRVGGG